MTKQERFLTVQVFREFSLRLSIFQCISRGNKAKLKQIDILVTFSFRIDQSQPFRQKITAQKSSQNKKTNAQSSHIITSIHHRSGCRRHSSSINAPVPETLSVAVPGTVPFLSFFMKISCSCVVCSEKR